MQPHHLGKVAPRIGGAVTQPRMVLASTMSCIAPNSTMSVKLPAPTIVTVPARRVMSNAWRIVLERPTTSIA